MEFGQLASYFQELETTPSRNAMTEILSRLFSQASVEEIDKICYLTQGRVAPLFVPLEFGMADKMMIKAISEAGGVGPEEVIKIFKKEGDLGKVAENIKNQIAKSKYSFKKLEVGDIYEELYRVAQASGEGSQDEKIKLIGELLKNVGPLSARYLVRIPLGKLRLGFSDMTILDALSWMLGKNKEARPTIEKAYNVRPDLGFVSKTVKRQGLAGLAKVAPKPGTPIMMARAERLSSGKEIIEKIGNCAVEPKIDGFRLAVHKDGERIWMFSRNMEDVTHMYPDLVEGVKKQVKAQGAILEGEAIAYNPKTGQYLPFQETVQRKRKYNIERMAQDVPLRLICFDLLYLNGRNFIHEPYEERRNWLVKTLDKGEALFLSEETVVGDAEVLEKIFQDSISRGLEGIMAKRLEGAYQAGARGWNWIKYKRSYAGKLEDTIDAVVMGYDFGQGKRVGFGIGDFLIGVYDKKTDSFKTIAKIGTGLTDEEWKELKNKSEKIKVKNKPARYDVDKAMGCDVWIQPQMVVVIRADEITRSPVHTAGRVLGPSKTGEAQEVIVPGFALRFPRLESFRDDKIPEDSTTLQEIKEMFALQGKKAN
jgi:DNA ligase-1